MFSIDKSYLEVDEVTGKFKMWTGSIKKGYRIGEIKRFIISFDNSTEGPIIPILESQTHDFGKVLDLQVRTVLESLLNDGVEKAREVGYKGPLENVENRQVSVFVKLGSVKPISPKKRST